MKKDDEVRRAQVGDHCVMNYGLHVTPLVHLVVYAEERGDFPGTCACSLGVKYAPTRNYYADVPTSEPVSCLWCVVGMRR
jgi:hypothetical protein